MKKVMASLLFLPTMASAEFISGNMLHQRMQSSDHIDRAFAIGYVIGVADAGLNVLHCASNQVTSGQTRDVVKLYLEKNPSLRDTSADILVVAALSQAWPCPKKKSGVQL